MIQKWKLTTGTSQSEFFSHDSNIPQVLEQCWCQFRNCNVHVLLAKEISRQSTSNAATKTTTSQSTENVEVWSKKALTDVKFEIQEIPQLFFNLELQSDRTETSIEYQIKELLQGQ